MIETVIHDRRSSLVGEKNMSHFPFRGSPTAQTTSVSSAPSTPPPTTTSMAVTSTVPPGARSSSPYSTTSGPPQNPRCCDTGRPILTDQATGQTICSCQLDFLNFRLGNPAGLTGPTGMPLSLYNPYGEPIPYFPGVGGEQFSGFYPNAAPGMDLKENLAAGGVPWPYSPVYYESALGSYPFNPYGIELNGARRKNATRETTSMLKAWLNDHKKNPYPTKGEKIMLAVVTKMTLTQVSTWFANARRRLKKENKMTWEPRNRVDDDDATIDDDDDHKSNDGKDLLDSKDSGTGSSEDGDRPSNRLGMLDHHHPVNMMGMKSDWHESRHLSGTSSPDISDRTRPPHPLIHPAALHTLRPMTGISPDSKHTPGGSTNPNDIKPRIWSLADMAKKENNNKDIETQPSQSSGLYPSNAGKIISPLAGRYPIHPSPYPKPEFYRSIYSPNPAHLTGGPIDHQALLEHYQFFNSSLANNRLGVMNPLAIKTKPGGPGGLPHPLAPLNLPINSTTPPSGISPSASSTSSGPEITSPKYEKTSSPISVTRP